MIFVFRHFQRKIGAGIDINTSNISHSQISLFLFLSTMATSFAPFSISGQSISPSSHSSCAASQILFLFIIVFQALTLIF